MKPGVAAIECGYFVKARHMAGGHFDGEVRQLAAGGANAVAAIETALKRGKLAAMVRPANQLKQDAQRLGAQSLAELAEDIELGALDCIEWGQGPGAMAGQIKLLRPAFVESLSLIERRVSQAQ